MIEETIRAVKDAEKKAEELLAGARADSDALAKEAGDGAAAILEEARTAAKQAKEEALAKGAELTKKILAQADEKAAQETDKLTRGKS